MVRSEALGPLPLETTALTPQFWGPGTLVIALASFQGALAKFSPQLSQDGIFYIATIIFLVTGMHTYLCPDDRWRELRATAEHIESEVFRFRTRTGAYSVSVSDPHATELTFRKKIEDLTTRAAQGAALGSSSFFRRYRGSVYMHGQNADTKMLRFDYKSVDKEAPVHIERCIMHCLTPYACHDT